MSEPADPIAAQDAILAKVTAFVREGVRSGRISAESAEMLTDAAEQQHREAVERIRAQQIREIVDAAPPPTPEQAARLRDLLPPPQQG